MPSLMSLPSSRMGLEEQGRIDTPSRVTNTGNAQSSGRFLRYTLPLSCGIISTTHREPAHAASAAPCAPHFWAELGSPVLPLMSRPYFNHSLDQLEQVLEAANGEESILAGIREELTHRRTPRARELADALEKQVTASVPRAAPAASVRPAAPRQPAAARQSSKKPKLAATSEQVEAVVAFTLGGSLKINAYAGTGKTSTLQLLADSTSRRGQYVAFNKSIVEDAKTKFPKSVNCSTLHGMAFRATPSEYRSQSDKMTGRCNANQLAELLKLTKNWRIDEHHTLQPRSQGYLILETVKRFAQSADLEPLPIHVPRHGSLSAAKEATLKEVEEFALKGARHVWSRMISSVDPLPLGHDGYLKLWALSDPQIAADYILLDEAQDTNPVVLGALRKQEAQMIYVGDRFQQIYEWRGAVNAMERIDTDATTLLSRSFRFGSTIADAASKVLSSLGKTVVVTGNSAIESRICTTDPTAILARTNAAAISAVIESLDDSRRPHLVGGIEEIMELLRGVVDLKQGQPATMPEFFGFSDWKEVVEFAKSGEGAHLLTFVNLVESRGEKQLMWALKETVEESAADVVISTAHKAKGREWDRVRLMDDFMRTRKTDNGRNSRPKDPLEDAAEIRLFYVAMTRAREELEIPAPLAAQFGIHCEERVIQPRRPVLPPPSRARSSAPVPAPWQPPQDWKPKQQTEAPRPAPPPPKKGLFDWLLG